MVKSKNGLWSCGCRTEERGKEILFRPCSTRDCNVFRVALEDAKLRGKRVVLVCYDE